jgi:hypothetical protein
MIDMTLTIGNGIMNSSRFAPNDRNVLLKPFLSFVSREELLSIATRLEDVRIEFEVLFVESHRITEFRNPLSGLSYLLDLINGPSQTTSIARLPSRSRENKLHRTSEVIRAARFADGRSVSSLLEVFKSSAFRSQNSTN